jgi:hypothetical protein
MRSGPQLRMKIGGFGELVGRTPWEL